MTKSKSLSNEAKWGIVLALPAILGFLIWTLGPMVASFILSFTDWNVVSTPHFIGIENFRKMFMEDFIFKKSIYATLYYTLGSVLSTVIFAFLIALLLNQKIKGLPIFRTIFYLPSITPAIASAMLWIWLFNPDFGLLNQLLGRFGIPRLQWIYDEKQVIPSLIFMSIWGMGGTMIIFLAGLQGIPQEFYEAVDMDGGNWWHKFRYITIPMMTPTIFFNLVMAIIGTFQVFTSAYIMTSGGPNYASMFYVYYIYLSAFRYGDMGYACALAVILFFIILSFTLVVFRSSPYWVYYESARRR
ncbi:MAG TPA: sugar ABC transporter permease [bacterium]|jgi:multiple sugar transport system permease protein|nr:sugar ABC transporter permease [Dictyoglomota bacterium]HHV80958.1 sugar ABC transporter permease [bacterium]HOL55600.1 sugar ABC transporter permease [bacterium]HOP56394.1 sugar ABC transporter permease [bacterium]HPC77763.1 sugar ABC transporter permease [bacterium]